MLLDNLKCPFLTDGNQKYQTKHMVHLLDKMLHMRRYILQDLKQTI